MLRHEIFLILYRDRASSSSLHYMFIQREIFNTEIKVSWKDKSLQQARNLNYTAAAKERKGREETGHC